MTEKTQKPIPDLTGLRDIQILSLKLSRMKELVAQNGGKPEDYADSPLVTGIKPASLMGLGSSHPMGD